MSVLSDVRAPFRPRNGPFAGSTLSPAFFKRMIAMTARENPIGLDGFEFVEFTSPDPDAMAGLFAEHQARRLIG